MAFFHPDIVHVADKLLKHDYKIHRPTKVARRRVENVPLVVHEQQVTLKKHGTYHPASKKIVDSVFIHPGEDGKTRMNSSHQVGVHVEQKGDHHFITMHACMVHGR